MKTSVLGEFAEAGWAEAKRQSKWAGELAAALRQVLSAPTAPTRSNARVRTAAQETLRRFDKTNRAAASPNTQEAGP